MSLGVNLVVVRDKYILYALHGEVAEYTTSLQHVDDERRAHHTGSIGVHPIILLDLREQVTPSFVLARQLSLQFVHLEVLRTQTHVEALTHQLSDLSGNDVLQDGEDYDGEVQLQKGREVGVGRIDPSKYEVVVSVGVTLHCLEPCLGLLGVEVGTSLSGEW